MSTTTSRSVKDLAAGLGCIAAAAAFAATLWALGPGHDAPPAPPVGVEQAP